MNRVSLQRGACQKGNAGSGKKVFVESCSECVEKPGESPVFLLLIAFLEFGGGRHGRWLGRMPLRL